MKTVIRHLRRAALLQEGSGPADERLLEMFLARRDETAFEALMRRHGPMVLGVCRRVLRNAHDVEDAFQATFLVLVRKASSLRSRELLANWLYGVAYRTSIKARAMNAKRRIKESHAGEVPRSESAPEEGLLAQLDYELSRLPDKYRTAVVLCELEGKSRKEVARLLGVPEGTLSSRLAQAKKRLARRLSRHGLAISGGTLAAALTPGVASACLRASTVKAVTAGSVPAKVLALTEGVMKAMLLTKLKVAICVATLALAVGGGVSGLTYRATAEEPKQLEYYKVFLRGNAESRPVTDDLEALRLEIEALRKSLQATRERVKTLEGEVTALKGKRQGPQGMAPGGMQGGRPSGMQGGMAGGPQGGMQGGRPGQGPGAGGPPKGGGGMMGMNMPGMPGMLQKATKSDPVADAENALRKLRENPGDKQATKLLERALHRIKEREGANPPS
jgi:RNA polymerase sigma factor (sigma-70 family)